MSDNVLQRTFREISGRLGAFLPDPNLSRLDTPAREDYDGRKDIAERDVLRPLPRRRYRDPSEEPGDTGQLDDETRRHIDGGIREQGFEALAFYKSFRFVDQMPFPGHWGIFYLDKGIQRVRELMNQYQPDSPSGFSLAMEFLRRHERIHFRIDVYALGLESALSKHLYEPLKHAFRGREIFQVEEALANNEVWRWAQKEQPPLQDFAENFMAVQPGAYARFSEDRNVLAAELAANLIDLNLTANARRDDQVLWVANLPNAIARWQSYCPEHIVEAQAVLSRWINPAWKMPPVRSIRDGKSVMKALNGKYVSFRGKWEETKLKLVKDAGLPGLDFKPWSPKNNTWSVRVDRGFRAHLQPIAATDGTWEAVDFGSHQEMGH